MIQAIHRSGPRAVYHVGVGGANPDNLTICGRWLRGARRSHMAERDFYALGDRRCRHCLRAGSGRRTR